MTTVTYMDCIACGKCFRRPNADQYLCPECDKIAKALVKSDHKVKKALVLLKDLEMYLAGTPANYDGLYDLQQRVEELIKELESEQT